MDGADIDAMVKNFIPRHFFPMLFDHWTILVCILSSNTYFLLDFLALLQQTLDTVDQDQSEAIKKLFIIIQYVFLIVLYLKQCKTMHKCGS